MNSKKRLKSQECSENVDPEFLHFLPPPHKSRSFSANMLCLIAHLLAVPQAPHPSHSQSKTALSHESPLRGSISCPALLPELSLPQNTDINDRKPETLTSHCCSVSLGRKVVKMKAAFSLCSQCSGMLVLPKWETTAFQVLWSVWRQNLTFPIRILLLLENRKQTCLFSLFSHSFSVLFCSLF